MPNVAVIGSTGGIGSHVVRLALEAGHTVQALARTPHKLQAHPRLSVTQGSVTDSEAMLAVVANADIVLSCLGTSRGQAPIVTIGTQHIIEAMAKQKVDRLAMISSVGVGDSATQGKRVSKVFMYGVVPLLLRSRFYELKEAEIVARTCPKAIVVRPTGLSNRAPTGRFHAVDSRSRETSMQIPRADVAQFLIDLITDTTHDGTSVSLFVT
jgi:nucleoside-diphosphate-sugar epimerase